MQQSVCYTTPKSKCKVENGEKNIKTLTLLSGRSFTITECFNKFWFPLSDN